MATDTRTALARARERLERAEIQMNATANYEGASTFTREGAARRSAVEAHQRAQASYERAKARDAATRRDATAERRAGRSASAISTAGTGNS